MTKILTAEELSKILRIPKRSIYRFAQGGHIPGGFRVGKHWRFKEDIIESWIDGQVGAKNTESHKKIKWTHLYGT